MSAWGASAWAFGLTFMLLGLVQQRSRRPLLLLGRLLPMLGWLEVVGLASYAAWVASKLRDPAQAPRWRRRIWSLFSVVFFIQLGLGLLGLDQFLMTPGKLHFPIPALIVAGPLYRGASFFMLVLFAATVLLVGPAWCSHLCYLGAWDQAAADRRSKPARIVGLGRLRAGVTILVVGSALSLRLLGASTTLAGGLALAFGLGGVALIALSRQHGLMLHCTVYCPVGLAATLLGRINPFRLVIASGCDGCMRCRLACRYGALDPIAIQRRRPRWSLCTLCGDCLASCRDGFLGYRLPGLSPGRARTVFVVLVVALHAATLGLARI